jgi:GNAT superfamily N-acetyltransferase
MKAGAAAPTIEVLAAERFRLAVPELAELLVDAVGGGASVGSLPPFTVVEAERWWRGLTDDVSAGRLLLLVLRVDGRALGTAQLRLAQLPNAQHRAEVAKVLVHSAARRRGYGRLLMEAVETAARDAGRHLLILDTLRGSDAERLYSRLGWTRAVEIPAYAALPDGRFEATTIFYKDLAPASAPRTQRPKNNKPRNP